MADNPTASSSREPSGTTPKGVGHNKTGKNQYKDRPLLDDPHVAELLNAYHLKGITDNRIISSLLLEEHGITLGERSIYRRKKMLGLWASKHTTKELSEAVKRQLVAAQMAKDPSGKLGARVVKQRVFQDTGLHLTRDYIQAEMRRVDPAAQAARGPSHILSKRQRRPASSDTTYTLAAPASTTLGSAITATSPNTPVVQSSIQEQQPSSDGGNANQSLAVHPRELNVRVPRRPRRARVTEASNFQSQSQLRLKQPPPSGPPLPSTASTAFLFHPISDLSSAPNFLASSSLQGVQNFPPSSLPLHSDEHEHNHWVNDANSEDSLRSPIDAHALSNDNGRTLTAEEERSRASGSSNILISSPHTSHTLSYPELSHPPPPPSSTSTHQNSISRTSTSIQDVVRAVRESTPKLRDLTQFIESLKLEEEDIDPDAYDAVLRGMETAALLERQLSRVVALARHSRPPLRMGTSE